MNKAEEKEIDFIKRRFVTADNLIVFDEQFEGYLNTILNKCRQSEIDELKQEVERLRKESYDILKEVSFIFSSYPEGTVGANLRDKCNSILTTH